jgi:hypothetical protein
MHIENELGEFMTVGEQEYNEVIEEYEEVLVQEEFLEPPVADTTDIVPAQGKPRCITHFFMIMLYMLRIYVAGIY